MFELVGRFMVSYSEGVAWSSELVIWRQVGEIWTYVFEVGSR